MATGRYVENLVCASSVTGGTPCVEMKSHPQVHALLLSHISKATIDDAETIRVPFMVLSTLQSGFSCANYNIEKPPPKGTRRDPADNLYIPAGKGMQVFKTYKLIGKGNKGPASTHGACVVPGMIFQSTVFKDQIQETFGAGDPKRERDYHANLPVDLPIFSQVVITLCSRSSESGSAKNGGLLQIKRVVPFEVCARTPFAPQRARRVDVFTQVPVAFGSRAMQPSLFPGTLDESMTRRAEFVDSEALTAQTGVPVDQSYIQMMLSPTRHVIRIPPEVSSAR